MSFQTRSEAAVDIALKVAVNEDITVGAGLRADVPAEAVIRPAAVCPCGQGRQGGQGAGKGKGKGAQAAAAQHGAVAFGKVGEGVAALFQHGEPPGTAGW